MNAPAHNLFEVVPLSQHIGAEIRGLDMSKPLDSATIKAIYQTWLDHTVIIFRGQNLTQEDHLQATSYFGTQGHIRRPPKYFPPGFDRVAPGIMFISNIRENGEPIGALPDGEMMFHHDMIHSDIPDKGTLLYSIEIPSSGGNTLFASGYAAYETMDPALRAKIEGRMAQHHYNYGSTQKGDGKGTEAYSRAMHPAVRTHEETGRKSLYVNRLMTVGLEGMSDEEAAPILEAVFDHCEKPEFVYSHKWRVGDLLLWDNRCSSHAREDFPANERRLMLRTTVQASVKPHF
jgi:taurine dioxygenase